LSVQSKAIPGWGWGAIGIVLLAVLLIPGCIRKTERPRKIDVASYYPLNLQDNHIYSGKIRSAVTSGAYEGVFTRTYMDSTGELVKWEDFIRNDRGIWLRSRILADTSIPHISFEPPLPAAPWSGVIGDTLHFSAVEIIDDSVNSHLRIHVECEILAIETLAGPAGLYENCIKMRMNYRTLDPGGISDLDGEYIFWFAEDIGIVKYIIPGDEGELLQATVGGKNWPE